MIILLVALAGGCLPLLVRWTDRLLHSALALSTGIFLGAVFLHLLPSLSDLDLHPHSEPGSQRSGEVEVAPIGVGGAGGAATTSGDQAVGHEHGDMTIWFFVLIGVLAVYLIEALVFRTHDHDDLHRHRAVGYAALVGLSIHALTTGIGFAAASNTEGLAMPVFVSIIAHKGIEGFSLASVFLLAEFRRRRIVILMALFSLVTPLGILLGHVLTDNLGAFGIAVATALAAGTFLYVCLCELLPEVFHHREDGLVKIGLLAVGIAVMVLFSGAGA